VRAYDTALRSRVPKDNVLYSFLGKCSRSWELRPPPARIGPYLRFIGENLPGA
jgi:hypothetical protein